MAIDTPTRIRNLVIYEVYVRNHGPNGSFADVKADLPRLQAMGVDIIWFMPIHPIGKLNKKGGLGCPYSIQDYREVNPEYGDKEEFERFCEYAHALGMKVMIDVVYNHTSHDALLVDQHPEWYNTDEEGRPVTTVPDWSDVVDLVYDDNPELWDYQIETLKMWAGSGVDGFRCDVASIMPLDFWIRARAEVARVKPDVIWLAESVHANFVIWRRESGLHGYSDGEVHQAFDLSYDYDIWVAWEQAVANPAFVPIYVDMVRLQKGIYPAHVVKMRCVENHDQVRIMQRAPNRQQALAWTAFAAFNEGPFLIYGGQESENTHTPSLFDIDKVEWGGYSLQVFLTALCAIKKSPEQSEGRFHIIASTPAITAHWQAQDGGLYGVFNVSGAEGIMSTPLPDGAYVDLIGGGEIEIVGGEMAMPLSAMIVRYTGRLDTRQHEQPPVIL